MIPYGKQWIDRADIEAVVRVLEGDWLTTGPAVPVFEEAVGRMAGCPHAVAVNSGTSALDIAVQALDLPEGSEVITTPLTFAATANAILYNRCRPVFADITPDTRNIDPEDIRGRITAKTRAIIAVDYAGHPCDWDTLHELADSHDLRLIDDACHAPGALYHGRRVGSLADMTVFSFHPVKHVTTGEGGAVTTADSGLAGRLRMLRDHGIDRTATAGSAAGAGYGYDMKFLGHNYRMTDFQAALGVSQLRKLPSFLRRRREIANAYRHAFDGHPSLEIPEQRDNIAHAWHLYTLLLRGVDRNSAMTRLRKQGIATNVHYIPVYRFSYYRERFAIPPDDYPVTEDVFSRILTIPLFPAMTDDEVDTVVHAVSALGSGEES